MCLPRELRRGGGTSAARAPHARAQRPSPRRARLARPTRTPRCGKRRPHDAVARPVDVISRHHRVFSSFTDRTTYAPAPDHHTERRDDPQIQMRPASISAAVCVNARPGLLTDPTTRLGRPPSCVRTPRAIAHRGAIANRLASRANMLFVRTGGWPYVVSLCPRHHGPPTNGCRFGCTLARSLASGR